MAKSQNGSLGGEDSVAGDLGSNGDNINVVVRVRPLNPREIKAGDDSVLQVKENIESLGVSMVM